jgi:prephenate dehydrogenase
VDVTSVKVKPVALMQKYLPRNVQILGTHPLFGPQSATATNLAGHKIIVYPARVKNLALIQNFLKTKLGLKIIRMTPAEHDKKMALLHGLTFFVARGLMAMQLREDKLSAPSYQKLLSLAALEQHHSASLFETIEAGNPYTAEVRGKLIKNLLKLHQQTLKKKF